jgi:hypothetical protein
VEKQISTGLRQQQVVSGARPPPAAAARPPRPPTAPHADEKQPTQQKHKVPVLEKHLVHQLSQEEQDTLNSKFQEASQADKKVFLVLFVHSLCGTVNFVWYTWYPYINMSK